MDKIFPAQITLKITPDVTGIGPAIAAELRTIADDIDPLPEPDAGVWISIPDPPDATTIETVARVIYENIYTGGSQWDGARETTKEMHRNNARAVLDALGGAA